MDNSFFDDLEEIIDLENLKFLNSDTYINTKIKNYKDVSNKNLILENNLLKEQYSLLKEKYNKLLINYYDCRNNLCNLRLLHINIASTKMRKDDVNNIL